MPSSGSSIRRFRLRVANAYLVARDGETILVDAGMPWDRDRLLGGLADAGFDAGDVDRVLVTHYDVDHVGTLATLGLREDVPIHAAEPDASYLTGAANPSIASHKGAAQRLAAPLVERPTNPVEGVDDGEEIAGFVAYHTPGHTPGHTAYVDEQLGVAFVGDMVRESRGRLVPAPWWVTGDTDRNRESIRDFADRCPPVDTIAMGHGDPIVEYGYGALKRVADRVR